MPTIVAIGFLSFVCHYDFRLVGITILSSGSQSLVPVVLIFVYTSSFFFTLSFVLKSHNTLSDLNTIFNNPGEDVTVEDEVVVINSIVLPHKTLNLSVQEEIIL